MMAKNESRHLPPELKQFWRLFSGLGYEWDYSRTFDAFVTIWIDWFADGKYQDERNKCLEPYSQQDKQTFNAMFYEFINAFDKLINRFEWFDVFGTIYEQIITSKGKQSGLGQFFTPPAVCDFMAQMQIPENTETETIYDPTAGSGRLLLASHMRSPKSILYGADIDLICCKMTAVNIFLHGGPGEVVWRNSLDFDSYYKGWEIATHPVLNLPYIRDLKKEDSFIYQVAQNDKPHLGIKFLIYCNEIN